jgi:hypothetical protein
MIMIKIKVMKHNKMKKTRAKETEHEKLKKIVLTN